MPTLMAPSAWRRLKIFQIAIKERVFVVPFNFQRNDALIEGPNVIYLMRYRFTLNAVDCLLDLKVYFLPAVLGQGATKTLCSLGFSPAAADDFLNRNRKASQN